MPLRGIKVVEMIGLAPGPVCGTILADFGATVTVVHKIQPALLDVMSNGKEMLSVNLKSREGVEVVKKLCASSDVLIDTYRPGVLEKIGLGPDVLMKENMRLIYARLSGYGQDGCFRDKPGHDINYTAISGLLSMLGRNGQPPNPPINMLADFAGGSVLTALGIVIALFERTKSGKGQIIDASLTEGTSYIGMWLFKTRCSPLFSQEPGKNFLDGGMACYNTYETKDGKFMAVGALEPLFYSNFIKGLELSEDIYNQQADQDMCRQKFQEVFLTKTRDEWTAIFDNLETCVTPVVDFSEVQKHKCNSSRKSFYIDHNNTVLPEPAPKLLRTPPNASGKKFPPKHGEHTVEILNKLGYSKDEIKKLLNKGISGEKILLINKEWFSITVGISYSQDNQRKEAKLRPEKSFLKQIFENKKRHSAIDISHVKLLPSISELDKQAAEIIKTNKLLRQNCDLKEGDNNRISEQNKIQISNTMWMCTKCLRRYNMTIKSCVYCVQKSELRPAVIPSNASSTSTQTELNKNKATSSTQIAKDIDEKKKLKEMLKEMKYSLPKKSNHTEIKNSTVSDEEITLSTETPTLRIGSTISENKVKNCNNNTAYSKVEAISNSFSKESSESLIRAIITSSNFANQPVGKGSAILEKKPSIINHIPRILNNGDSKNNIKKSVVKENPGQIKTHEDEPVICKPNKVEEHKQTKRDHATATEVIITKDLNSSSDKLTENLNVSQSHQKKVTTITNTPNVSNSFTPLRISSLLNPISQPKITDSNTKSQVIPILKNIETNATKNILPMKSESLQTSDNLKSEIISTPIKNSAQNKDTSSNSSSNKVKLDPKIVSQIIKKSIDKKQNSQAEASADISKGEVCDHAKRRDLINQLELSIAKGDEMAAAEAAAKLAKLRLSCSVLSFSSQIVAGPSTSRIIVSKQEKNNYTNGDSVKFEEENTKLVKEPTSKLNIHDRNDMDKVKKESALQNAGQDKTFDDNIVSIEVWIEDKVATRGPVRLNIPRQSTVADLRREAAISLGLAVNLQRWIVGKTLCTDNNVQVFSLAGASFNVPFYLCLVESAETKTCKEAEKTSKDNQSGDFYTELIKLEQQALISNTENFECGVCIEDCAVGNGVVLRECLHTFCRECLSDVVRHSEEPVVSCPAIGCLGVLQDREIRALLSQDDYEKWLARSLATAESGTRNTFHCRTPDCSGWAFCEAGVRIFPCPVCKMKNCIPCQAVHDGDTCEQYQRKLRETVTVAEANNAEEGTQALLNSLISRGEALECPECRAIITKKWGCDWVKCSACKTEICWVTKGRRWGPAGRGDTSGGCRCGVDGQRCHPTCGYCH